MNNFAMNDYEKIAKAINYIDSQAQQQPNLDDIARHLNLSASHVQKLFSRWAGISPKQFLQAVNVERAKFLLKDPLKPSLMQVSDELGFSSASRLYDHFVTLEAMTPGEYRLRGKELTITYGAVETPYGKAVIAFTERGICEMSYVDAETESAIRQRLKSQWFLATLIQDKAAAQKKVQEIFSTEKNSKNLKLNVRGTNFQIAVWRALLKIPCGALISYGDLARAIDNPNAVRAVGSAVGSNPVSLIIPCHRAIRASGALGGYRGGLTRKKALLLQELNSPPGSATDINKDADTAISFE